MFFIKEFGFPIIMMLLAIGVVAWGTITLTTAVKADEKRKELLHIQDCKSYKECTKSKNVETCIEWINLDIRTCPKDEQTND